MKIAEMWEYFFAGREYDRQHPTTAEVDAVILHARVFVSRSTSWGRAWRRWSREWQAGRTPPPTGLAASLRAVEAAHNRAAFAASLAAESAELAASTDAMGGE